MAFSRDIATGMVASDFPKALSKHRQLGNTCIASGFECLAKLHGFLAGDEHPLQNDTKNPINGFNPPPLLDPWFECLAPPLNTGAEAVDHIRVETGSGRYPLISLFEWDNNNHPIGWHVFLLSARDGRFLLLNPRDSTAQTYTSKELEVVLEHNRTTNPERRSLHMLTYRVKPQAKPAIDQLS